MKSQLTNEKQKMALEHEIKRLFRKYNKEDIAFTLLKYEINILKKPEESNHFQNLAGRIMSVSLKDEKEK